MSSYYFSVLLLADISYRGHIDLQGSLRGRKFGNTRVRPCIY